MLGTFNSSVIVLLSLIVFSFSPLGSSHAQDRPNILWITSEDNSPFIGVYGDEYADTPNIDQLAERGVLYENAYATTPVCAPSRFTLITGTYANRMGTENMRSSYPIPEEIQFYPKYLREAGYYTTNNAKKDYNTVDQPEAWDESSSEAHYRNREDGQPFFHVRNLMISHESSLHAPIDTLVHDPERAPVPPYHPETEAVKKDWAHYYDQVTKMDAQVGEVLADLEESGEAENTIVFYYSDHGGAVPGSKRFMNQRGLHVPLIVYFPPKYKHLAPDEKRTDRLVSFVDFPATLLSLAGIEPLEFMDGKPFLGEYEAEPREYVHTYRGRMDERYDLSRGVRDSEFLYVRNYMPHRIYGQHLSYLWQAPSMQSWGEEYNKGVLDDVQRRFFESKPSEELYRVSEDPHTVNNLADDPAFREMLERMRKTNADWVRERVDLGFIPEELVNAIRGDQSLYEAVRGQSFPIDVIIETAELATRDASEHLETLASRLDHPNGAVRFWAATGFSVAAERPGEMEQVLLNHADDPLPVVRVAVAEALYRYGDHELALDILEAHLDAGQHPLTKLRALNTIEALNIQPFPSGLTDKIQQLRNAHPEVWGGEVSIFINWASTSLLGD